MKYTDYVQMMQDINLLLNPMNILTATIKALDETAFIADERPKITMVLKHIFYADAIATVLEKNKIAVVITDQNNGVCCGLEKDPAALTKIIRVQKKLVKDLSEALMKAAILHVEFTYNALVFVKKCASALENKELMTRVKEQSIKVIKATVYVSEAASEVEHWDKFYKFCVNKTSEELKQVLSKLVPPARTPAPYILFPMILFSNGVSPCQSSSAAEAMTATVPFSALCAIKHAVTNTSLMIP